jgi:MoxR-like ATPase
LFLTFWRKTLSKINAHLAPAPQPLEKSVLRNLGIYGCDEIEPFLLTGLITSDNLILLGDAGASKTRLVEQLLGLWHDDPNVVKAYSVPTINMEDLLGFTDPAKLMEGTCDFIRGPMTIWQQKGVLFGEINRTNPDMQGKIFQLLQERKVMGMDVDTIHAWADMNPLSHAGTQPLTQALADRFLFALTVPAFHSLSGEDQLNISQKTMGSTFRGLPKEVRDAILKTEDVSKSRAEAKAILDEMTNYLIGENGILVETFETWQAPVGTYLSRIVTLMKANYMSNTKVTKDKTTKESTTQEQLDLLPSGRRIQMLARAIIVGIAIRQWMKGAPLTNEEVANLAVETFKHSDVNGKTTDIGKLDIGTFSLAHTQAKDALMNTASGSWSFINNLTNDPQEKLFCTLRGGLYNKFTPSLRTLFGELCLTKYPHVERVTIKNQGEFFENASPDSPISVDFVEDLVKPMAYTRVLSPLLRIPDLHSSLGDILSEQFNHMVANITMINYHTEFIIQESAQLEKAFAKQRELYDAANNSPSNLDCIPLYVYQILVRGYFMGLRFTDCTDTNPDFKGVNYDLMWEAIDRHVEAAKTIVGQLRTTVEPVVQYALSQYYDGVTVPDFAAVEASLLKKYIS